jgi:chitinase
MNKSFRLSLLTIILSALLGQLCFSQFKKIGYVPFRVNSSVDLDKINFDLLTHINLAFVNPDSLGNLVLPSELDPLIRAAHDHRVKVLASIGGGSFHPYLAVALRDSARPAYIQKLVQLCEDRQLDGIDVDVENAAIDSNYGRLVRDLSHALKKKHKLLTAALATWNGDLIPENALKKFDFINVMSYDQTGPWTPDRPGPHSTYEKAVSDLQYWVSIRGVPKEKVNLGVPFYGYCFGTKYGESMSYRDILNNFAGADTTDVQQPDSGGVIHYNGLATIKKKTELALNQAGGLMIWQILQDAEGERSLLFNIDQLVKASGKK